MTSSFNLVDNLPNDKKVKFQNLKALLTDLNDEQCFELLENNQWNVDVSSDPIHHRRINRVVVGKDEVSVNKSWKRKFVEVMKNEIFVSENREKVHYLPVLSRHGHPWLYQLIVWSSMPLTVAFRLFRVLIRFIFFWRWQNEQKTHEFMELQEIELMEQLSQAYLVPVQDSGSVALFLGSFEEAIAQAKHEYKFLLVYLHRLGNKSADEFLSSTLLHSETINLLNDPDNILIWVGYLSSFDSTNDVSEAPEISNLLGMNHNTNDNFTEVLFHEPESPFLLALIGTAMANQNRGRQQLSVIGQLERPIAIRELMNLLRKWIDIGNRPRMTIKKERASRDAVQNLRREQEAAFSEVLARDKEREAKLQSEIDELNALSIKKEDLRVKLAQMMEEVLLKIQDKEENLDLVIVNLMIRMHNGRRFKWTFDTKFSVKYLYYVVYCQDDAPFRFELLWGYPQKLLGYRESCLETNEIHLDIDEIYDAPSFLDIGIKSNQVVLVRDIDA